MLPAAIVHAEQICKPDSIPASTPDSQLVDNGNGTVTDSKTGLMWKKCLEGASGNSCEIGSPSTFTWQDALQQTVTVNSAGGFAGHTDWRLPSIRELRSLVEEQCCDPAINSNRFPHTLSLKIWSGSPHADLWDNAWFVEFFTGGSGITVRSSADVAVRLVRGGN